MKSIQLMGATFNSAENRVEVVKMIINDDDTTELNLHSISVDTLEWRAAELGTDNITELLDVILYEPFVDEPNDRTDIVGKVRRMKQSLNSKPQNKAAHKDALRQAGVHQRYVDAVDDDPYAVLAEHCHFDAQVIAMKAQQLTQMKRQSKEKPDVDRLTRVAHTLTSKPVRTPREVEPKIKQLNTIELGKQRRKRNG